jgi:molecular chaperone DnaK
MNRTTIDFGIDLGTTNSAIAIFNGVASEIIKNILDHDITPSAVHIDKKGTPSVGFRAKQRIIQWPDDTFTEFKRLMGSNHVYVCKSSGRRWTPEELSAEVLKELKGDVQRKTAEMIDAAVVTVPAVFQLEQCDATKKAAELAGFKQSALLQEPVAAALAFGFLADRHKAHWLVYDFGGGTFDAAIIKAEEGTIHVVNHGGDNHLGGSDIDKALVSKLIVSRIVEEYGLEDFDWAHASEGGRWREAFARLKWAAEEAKIELSSKAKVSLDPLYAGNIRDEVMGEVVIEELDLEITQGELIRIAEPFITRAVEIAKRVLKEAKLPTSSIEKVILVGGPTVAPYVRQMLADGLGIPLDHSVDPFTVVARGAAIFAATQHLDVRVAAPAAIGEYQLELAKSFKPVGVDSTPTVGGRVSGASAQDFTGFSLQLMNTKTQWRSGKVSLGRDGVFLANLLVEKGERNTFAIELYDASGRKQKLKPDTLAYTIGIGGEQPLINSMGIMLANREYACFFKKGVGLPLRKTWPKPFYTVKPLRQGQSGEFIWIPIVEGEHNLADRNHLIKRIAIEAEKIPRDLPVGSEVEITLRIDESRIVWLKAYVPLLDQDFEFKINLASRPIPEWDLLKAGWDAEMARMRDLRSKAVEAKADTARDIVATIEQSMLAQGMEETLAAATADSDSALKFENQLLELQLKNDEAANLVEWPVLEKEAHDWIRWLQQVADPNGSIQQKQKAGDLAAEVEGSIRDIKPDRLRKKIEQIAQLYHEIVMAQTGWWIYQFQQMEKQQEKMSDQAKAGRLLGQGRDCLGKNNVTGLQNVVRQLWHLLPDDVSEAAKHHPWDPGLIQ